MISKSKVTYLKSLQQKKFRKIHQAFLVEGEKSTAELLLSDFQIESLYCTDQFYQKYQKDIKTKSVDFEIVTSDDLKQAGVFSSNQSALASVIIPYNHQVFPKNNEFVLVLDGVQDPGNMGTIIRIADWYGIDKIVCSEDTVDLYNPKVIAATMASFIRIKVFYTDLEDYFSKFKEIPVYGALLSGDNIHESTFDKQAFILMGNEAHGIRDSLMPFIHQKISIPRFGKAESLNVAMATAIICDNLRRKY